MDNNFQIRHQIRMEISKNTYPVVWGKIYFELNDFIRRKIVVEIQEKIYVNAAIEDGKY